MPHMVHHWLHETDDLELIQHMPTTQAKRLGHGRNLGGSCFLGSLAKGNSRVESTAQRGMPVFEGNRPEIKLHSGQDPGQERGAVAGLRPGAARRPRGEKWALRVRNTWALGTFWEALVSGKQEA